MLVVFVSAKLGGGANEAESESERERPCILAELLLELGTGTAIGAAVAAAAMARSGDLAEFELPRVRRKRSSLDVKTRPLAARSCAA